eukprot:scaffold2526_cov131-Cylindrotheca_fusiformis.AAC.19
MMFYTLLFTANILPRVAWGLAVNRREGHHTFLGQQNTVLSVAESSDNDNDIDKDVSGNDLLISDRFLTEFFVSECDNFNSPPSLGLILRSIDALASGSDVRGQFVDHPRLGNPTVVAKAIDSSSVNLSALTPFAAFCFGSAFASIVKESNQQAADVGKITFLFNFQKHRSKTHASFAVICVGRDPRSHGTRLSDAFCRGVEEVQNVRVVYTGIATTPSLFAFCR